MSYTAEYNNQYPAVLKDEVERLEKEVAALRKQRKEEGAFLDIRKEEARLESLHKDALKVIDDANVKASDTILLASQKADEIVKKATEAAEHILVAAAKKMDEASEMKDLEVRALEKSAVFEEKLLERERTLDARSSNLDARYEGMKAKAKKAIDALNEI